MKKRIQVTINSKLVDDAKHMMSARGFDSFSEFLESLIREETDRRRAVTSFQPSRYPELSAGHTAMNAPKKKK